MFDFGSRLKELRNKRGITQETLAHRINKSIGAVSGYETNIQTPPTDVVVSIAQVLNTSVAFLLDEDDDKCYSSKNLTKEERKLMDLIYAEFTEKSSSEEKLSERQIEIVRRLMILFS